ncbi:hypothetical protein EIN_379770 [Entamoeba invadens IP1]|uniref:Uncharacterized protein n=1 Tax=Entamoeba invadens IP1 TaxID=370355 RepID=A0A0A1UAS9_ENTIV|nr:hypothetical protein EIN_379770 [Entamoeba invadens IP1]ELP92090.1 hypothetical protein EIN_379770 [Entamoeba invadens IP1]|eukprot:XP_004258861.1 hypothetical protein EIN_379770 [Entamoeba invadens IP1]
MSTNTEQPAVAVEHDVKPVADKLKKDKKKTTKKEHKEKKVTKLVYGASNYEPEEIVQKETSDVQMHKKQKKSVSSKPKMGQPQPQVPIQEITLSHNILCLFDEDSLASGSFVRRYMDDNGFVSVVILSKMLGFPPESFPQAVEVCKRFNSKITMSADNTAVGLGENSNNYALPLSERITHIDDSQSTLMKLQAKTKEKILRNAGHQDFKRQIGSQKD